MDSFEKGFFKQMYSAMEKDFYDLAKSKIKFYFNLDEFLNDFVKLDGQTLIYENYKTLFYLFYSIQTSILILFFFSSIYQNCFKYLVKFFEKQINLFLRFTIQILRNQIQFISSLFRTS